MLRYRKIYAIASLWALIFIVCCALQSCAYLNDNFRAVEESKFYRAGQMTGHKLSRVIETYGIKTVISLRGAAPESKWYRNERAACAERGVRHFDLGWSKDALPTPESLATFVSIVTEGEGPFLAHCQGGTHRSGVASAVYVLIKGGSVEEARKQFLLFFNDAPIGRLIDLYAESSLPFQEWVKTTYPKHYESMVDRSDRVESQIEFSPAGH